MNETNQQNTNYLIIGIALLNVIIHLIFSTNMEYHRDELLYFSLGLHPDWGYWSVPPLIAWMAYLVQHTLGYSVFAVKFLPALLSGPYIYLGAKVAKELGENPYAQLLTALGLFFTMFNMRAFHLFQPVAFDFFFWTWITYYILRYINTNENKYFYYLAIILGIAILNKYLVLLFLIALIPALLLSKHRLIFQNKHFYFSILLCLIIVSPNLIWQIANDFPAIFHVNELNEVQLVHVNRWDIIIDQFVMLLGASFLFLLGFWYLLKSKEYQFLGITAFLVFTILIILRGKGYYALGVVAFMVAAGSCGFASIVQNKFSRTVLPILMGIIWLAALPNGLPIFKEDGLIQYFKILEEKTGLTIGRRFEDGTIHSLPQDYADQLGWEELTQIAALAYQKVDDPKRVAIYGSNYGQAAAISIIGKGYDLPEAVSFSDSFFFWKPEQFDPDLEQFIYINDEMGEDVKNLFAKIEIVGQISNPHAREVGTRVYLCSQPNRSFNAFWAEILQQFEED